MKTRLEIGKHTISDDETNVYIDDKIVFKQNIKGDYIDGVKIWNGNDLYWSNCSYRIQSNNKTNRLNNIINFVRTLVNIPLDDYIKSTNCKYYEYYKEEL